MSLSLRPTPMIRFLAAAAVLALPVVAAPAIAQSAATGAALQPRPAAVQAHEGHLAPGLAASDSISAEQLSRRVASYYTRQADLVQADADGDVARYNRLLDALVLDVQMTADRPGVLFDARFREVYSSVLTEYEQFYNRPAIDRGDAFAFFRDATSAVEPMFAFSTGDYQLEHVTLPDVRTSFATEIPMDVNAKVERYIRFLLARPGHVERLRQRADTYFPMVERVLAEEGVPDELKYLAMVESALNPSAYSHAGAAGMWQFIRATGRAYGLKAENQIDERLDPEKATRAAARHLKDLHDRFGNWQLALAGYNCNPAVIARASRRFEQRTGDIATFWDIDGAIPRETRAYVPMFIATSLVLSNPDAYGLPAPERGPRYAFDRVPVEGGTRLSSVARVMDVDESVIRALNPSLRQGRAPSGRAPHMVRIPAGMYEVHATALDRLAPPTAEGPRYAIETVQFGSPARRPLAPLAPSEALIAASQQAGRSAPLVALRDDRPSENDRPAARVLDQARLERQALASAEAATRPPLLSPRITVAPAIAALTPEPETVPEEAPVVTQTITIVPNVAMAVPAETAPPAITPTTLVAEPIAAAVEETTDAPAEPAAAPSAAVSDIVAAAMPAALTDDATQTDEVADELAAAAVEEIDAAPVLVAEAAPDAAPAVETPTAATPTAEAPADEPALVAQATPTAADDATEEPVAAPTTAEPETPAADLPATATGLLAPGLMDLARTMGTPNTPTPVTDDAPADVAQASAPEPDATPADATPVRTVSSRPTTYVVQRGEYLYMLARRFGTTVTELKRLNGIGDTVHPGQRLKLPGAAPTAATSSPRGTSTVTHRVRAGDTLSALAVQYGVTVRQIQGWNDLSGTALMAGQRLRIETTRRGRTVRG